MSLNGRMLPSAKSFTLIELLLVVAVIVILAGLLLPALSTAREKAKQINCANNLKQCGFAMLGYTNDYNGAAWMFKVTPNYEWPKIFNDLRYLPNEKLAACPSMTPYYYDRNLQYGYLAYGFRSPYDSPASYWLISYTGATLWGYFYPYKINNPSSFLYFADTYSSPVYPQIYIFRITNGAANDNGIHIRHNNNANCWFADGHVKACNKQELLGYEVKWMWAGTGNYAKIIY